MSIFDVITVPCESLYGGRCDIYEYQPENGIIDSSKEVKVKSDVPCRLSYKSILSSVQSETVDIVSQEIKLFLSPDIEVKEGSKVVVTQNCKTETYYCSGTAAVYNSHQEIELKLERGYA